MITTERVTTAINEAIAGTNIYLVDLKVSPNNKIAVFLDTDTRITLDECKMVNRALEQKLNRDKEDFDLTVSSPGLDEPLKHIRQYKKRIGSQVAAVTKDGQKAIGKLIEVTDDGITIEEKTVEKVEGKKTRQTIINNITLNFNQIKQTKLVLSF